VAPLKHILKPIHPDVGMKALKMDENGFKWMKNGQNG
jgi:hypothetical protein